MVITKRSKQREAILAFLQTRKDHPNAETVYQNVRKDLPNISLGTVYRNLTLLANQGTILKLHMEDGIDHFDADTSPHFHFLCSKCQQVSDISIPFVDNQELDMMANTSFEGEIEGHMTYFYGICPQCLKN